VLTSLAAKLLEATDSETIMKRREFITLLGGAAATWPLAARAQQQSVPVVGFLNAGSPGPLRQQLAAFHDSLKQAGYVEGQNVAVEYRFAEGQFGRFPAFASDLVRRRVSVIYAASNPGVLAAKQATTTIPIVFTMGEDPVKLGIVTSLNRPNGNLTGLYQFTTGLEAKRLGLLRELVPNANAIAILINPSNPGVEAQVRDAREAAARLSVRLIILTADTEGEFGPAFATLVRERAGALLVAASPFFNSRREQLVVLAARHAVPAIYVWRDFATAGGLMSYGTSLTDVYRQAADYVGRILKGAKPADLPVVQSTKFEFVINLSTAKALGIAVPGSLSARADEVIE
jgi:putative ABC transport system substrate-binding protein